MKVKANRLEMELRTKRTFVLHLFGVKFEIVWNQFCYVFIYIFFTMHGPQATVLGGCGVLVGPGSLTAVFSQGPTKKVSAK